MVTDVALAEDMTFFFEIIRMVATRSFIILTKLLAEDLTELNHNKAVHVIELLKVEATLLEDFKGVLQYEIRNDSDKIQILEHMKQCYSSLESKTNLYKDTLLRWREDCIVHNIDYKVFPLLKDIYL